MQKLVSLFKIVIVNILVLLLMMFVTNLLLGVYLKSSRTSRADLPNYENNRELAREIFYDYARIRHIYSPFVGWKTLPYKGETLTIGEDGNRIVPNNNANLASDKIKVGFFGGSTLWGEGSSDAGTIPSQFASNNTQYKIYNFGQLAYNSRQNLASLINLYSSGLKLDIVIFYDGVNDAAFLCPDQVSVPGHRMEPVFKERLYSSSKHLINKALYKYFIKDIINFTRRIRIKYLSQQLESEYLCYKDENKIKLIADGLLANWQLASQMVEANGGKFIGILQPMAYRSHPKIDYLEKLDPELGESMNMVYDRVLKGLDEDYLPTTLNLVDAFDKNEYIYIDFCHVSPNGNKIIADRITEFINHNIPID